MVQDVTQRIKLTRPELKRYRDVLARCERYLPMLKLKQQQLQMTLRDVAQKRRQAEEARDAIRATLRRYESVLADRAGIPLQHWARVREVRTSTVRIAGIEIPVFEDVVFPTAVYSLFGTPVWVDQTLGDLRERSRREAALGVVAREEALLTRELTRVLQRINLFEKIMIPRARDAIRMIRIKLGDEMTAAVGRAKIAKDKLAETLVTEPGETAGPEISGRAQE